MVEVVILGAGGHARVLVSALRKMNAIIVGCITPDPPDDRWPSDIPWLGPDSVLASRDPARTSLVAGVGGIRSNERRRQLFERVKVAGFTFQRVLHPNATIADDVSIEEGAVIMAGALVQSGCRVGVNAIINTGAIVDHDCRIGAHAHVAPGACLSGDVSVGEGAHIGTGACVIQGVTIGSNALLAAGCVVVRNVAAGGIVAGVPARPMTGTKS
jgi:UDP-perosamine 4-acetyltransferase